MNSDIEGWTHLSGKQIDFLAAVRAEIGRMTELHVVNTGACGCIMVHHPLLAEGTLVVDRNGKKGTTIMTMESSGKSMQDLIDKENPLVEVIARAIFESNYKRKWDDAKVHDQWLAKNAWDTALNVFRVLPLAVRA